MRRIDEHFDLLDVVLGDSQAKHTRECARRFFPTVRRHDACPVFSRIPEDNQLVGRRHSGKRLHDRGSAHEGAYGKARDAHDGIRRQQLSKLREIALVHATVVPLEVETEQIRCVHPPSLPACGI